jgi:hypothetical protein
MTSGKPMKRSLLLREVDADRVEESPVSTLYQPHGLAKRPWFDTLTPACCMRHSKRVVNLPPVAPALCIRGQGGQVTSPGLCR